MPVVRLGHLMSRDQIASMFPNASRSLLEANGAVTLPNSARLPESRPKISRPKMTKTEADFGRILEARKARGEIISYQFHGLTLRWSDGTRYTPDWVALERIADCSHHQVVCYETKGGYIFPGAKRRFKEARDQNPWAQFQMWQKKAGPMVSYFVA